MIVLCGLQLLIQAQLLGKEPLLLMHGGVLIVKIIHTTIWVDTFPLWRHDGHNGRDGISNHQPHNCLIVYSTVDSGGDHRKNQSSALLAFLRGIHRWPVNSPHKWSVTQKMFPFDDVIMQRKRPLGSGVLKPAKELIHHTRHVVRDFPVCC